jgi:hypothetical protein
MHTNTPASSSEVSTSTPTTLPAAKPPRRWKKLLGVALVLLMLALGAAIFFAPAIASSLAPGIIRSQAAKHVKGSVSLAKASFSWGGPQGLDTLIWKDEQGQEIAKLSLSSSASLLKLAGGSLDLGDVKVQDASLKLVRAADGTLNVQRLLVAQAPAAAPGGGAPATKGPASLPAGLRVALTIDKLDATFIDETSRAGAGAPATVELRDVKGSATLDPMRPLKLNLTANASSPSTPTPGGIVADIVATNWAKPDGTLTLDTTELAATIKLTALPTALVDALAGPLAKDAQGAAVPLARALGPTLDTTIEARGTIEDASAKLTLAMARASATGELRVAKGVLTSQAPLTIQVQGEALADLVPALGAALDANAPSRIERVPNATLTVDAMSITLPRGGAALDLRGAVLSAGVMIDAVRGQVALGAGQAPKPMGIAPIRATIQTSDAAKDVRVQFTTSATIASAPAGDVAGDFTLAQLLNNVGGLAPSVRTTSVRGTAKVTQIATAIAQPFVQQLGLDLPREVGPLLDLSVTAASTPGAGSIDVDFMASAESLNANGAITVSSEQVTTRGRGVRIIAQNAGRLAGALAGKNNWIVGAAPGVSEVVIDVSSATLRKDSATHAYAIEKSNVVASIAARGLTIANAQAHGVGPITLDDVTTNLTIDTSTVRAVVQGSMQHQGQPFRTRINIDLPGLLQGGGKIADAVTLRPRGSVSIDDLPSSVLAMVSPAPTVQGATEPGAMDVAGLLREIIGPVSSITLETKPGEGSALDARMTLQSSQLTVESSAMLSNERIAMQGPLVIQTNITPEVFEQVLTRVAPTMASRPRLTATTQARLEVQPLVLPLDAQRKPLLAQGGTLDATLTIPTNVVFDNVSMGEGKVARLGAQGLRLQVQAPLASLLPQGGVNGGTPGEGKLTLKGNILGEDRVLGVMDASLRATLSAGKPLGLNGKGGGGTITLASTVSSLDTKLVESLLGKPGLLSGALGDTAAVWLDASGTPDNANASLTLQAPNLTTSGPLKLLMRPDRLELAEPASLTLRAQPSFVNALLAPKGAGGGGGGTSAGAAGSPALTLVQPATIEAKLDRMILPRGAQGAAPDVSATLAIPSLALRTSDNRALQLSTTTLTVRTESQTPGRAMNFALVVEDAKVDGAEGSGKLSMTGAMRNVMDAQGRFDVANAVVDAKGKMPAFPTAIADVFAKQDGLLVDALGPIVDVDLDVRGMPVGEGGGSGGGARAPGSIDFQARSPRASAAIKGEIGSGVLTCSQPLTANLVEVTRLLSNRVIKGLPLLGSFEKTAQDAPAVLSGTGVTIPLSSDFSKLNGEFKLDPGEARFGTSGVFGELLNVAGLKTGGVVGRRLEPITVSVRQGVATYPKWTLPLGEFNVQTEGTVDMVSRTVDVVTWIPLGALSDQAAGRFNTGLGAILGGAAPQMELASMLPFRTRGSLDNPKTEPDLKLFAETALKTIKPEKIIEKGIGELLKGLGKKKEPK